MSPEPYKQILDWFTAVGATVAALAGVFTAFAAFRAIKSGNKNAQEKLENAKTSFQEQNRTYKLSVGAEWLFKLDEKFDSDSFRFKRYSAANKLKYLFRCWSLLPNVRQFLARSQIKE